MSRLHIDVGQAHDVTPRALVGAITGESGIPGRSVGAIDIQNNFSIVEISAELAAHVLATLNKGVFISGVKVSAKAADETDSPHPRKPFAPGQRWLRGVFSGGTLAYEAQLLLRRVLQRHALDYFGGRLDEYMHRLAMTHPGVLRPALSLTGAKTRWGSCSAQGNLNFHWKLILMPPEVLDYVVVHELCHRMEMNHSQAFWKEVEKILPDYQERQKWLKDNGWRLMEEGL